MATRIRLIGIAVSVLAIVLVLSLTPEPVAFKSTAGGEVLSLLGTLLFVALLIERALEVFVNTWRSEGAKLTEERDFYKSELGKLEAMTPDEQAARKPEMDDLRSKLKTADQARTAYRSVTMQFALWGGLTLGLLTSAVGVRTLQPLVDPASLVRLGATQQTFFHVVDVLLTGGLLAGGSDAIHKLTSLYVTIMEGTAERLRGKAP